MKTKNTNTPYTVDTEKVRLKIFQIGDSPRLQIQEADASEPWIMKGIHTHFTYEVFFIKGKLQLVTDDFTHIYENSVLILPPSLRHYSFPLSGECFCLLFSLESHTPSAQRLQKILYEGITLLPLSQECAFYIARIAEKRTLGTAEAERDISLLCALIFNEIIDRLLPSKAKSKPEAASSHMNEIEAYINTHLQERITLAAVASSVHLCTKQIERIVWRECACTFLQLVTDKRLASAEMLLKNSDMKISEIAAQTFQGSESYFYTVFKKKYGVTPQKYRKEVGFSKMPSERSRKIK